MDINPTLNRFAAFALSLACVAGCGSVACAYADADADAGSAAGAEAAAAAGDDASASGSAEDAAVNTPSGASAADLDWDATGSVSLTFKTSEGKAVAGGHVFLYQVAKVVSDDGNMAYEFVNGFENCGVVLGDLKDVNLATTLKTLIASDAKSTELAIGSDGKAVFKDLELGLYLVLQTDPATGYQAISPFLVSVPMSSAAGWVYDVDASPKMETVNPNTPTNPNMPKTADATTDASALAAGAAVGAMAIAGGAVLLASRKRKGSAE